MRIHDILSFLSDLQDNNHREWFALHKERYEMVRRYFEQISDQLILEISRFDEEVKHLTAKDCVFRIYRDTRFAADKTPYKTHFGVFIAAGGGRKSERGGYYLHLEPGKSFVAAGVWSPPPPLLKALRQSVFENIDELKEIMAAPSFTKHFTHFYDKERLIKAPKGFPADFPEVELLKLKHYMVEYILPESMLESENFIADTAGILHSAYPLNRFLNYTVDEVI